MQRIDQFVKLKKNCFKSVLIYILNKKNKTFWQERMKEFKEKEKRINVKTFYNELKSTWPVISHAIALTASELSIDPSKTLITSIEAH